MLRAESPGLADRFFAPRLHGNEWHFCVGVVVLEAFRAPYDGPIPSPLGERFTVERWLGRWGLVPGSSSL